MSDMSAPAPKQRKKTLRQIAVEHDH